MRGKSAWSETTGRIYTGGYTGNPFKVTFEDTMPEGMRNFVIFLNYSIDYAGTGLP